MQHERVGLVESSPSGHHLGRGVVTGQGGFLNGRGPAQLYEEAVGRISQLQVTLVHIAMLARCLDLPVTGCQADSRRAYS
jgi:hypothetical protein